MTNLSTIKTEKHTNNYSIKNHSYDAIVDALLAAAKQECAALALWSLPPHQEINFIIDLVPIFRKLNFDRIIKAKYQGFVLNPFCSTDTNRLSLFLRPHGVLEEAHGNYNIFWDDEDEPAKKNKIEAFTTAFEHHLKHKTKLRHSITPALSDFATKNFRKELFIDLVKDGITQIKKGRFTKFVVARNMMVPLPASLSWSTLFDTLRSSYPQTLISLVSTPEFGTWLGASPEILLSVDQKNIATTVALAGTRKQKHDGDVRWSDKERREQGLVTDFINDVLKDAGVQKYQKDNSTTHSMGHLRHLKETFQFDLNHPDNAVSIDKLIYKLHPTPAVCGLPQKEAFHFIQTEEMLDRSLYTGFLGPVNFTDPLNLYVDIRCAQLFKDNALIYAGAGITADSDPLAEWEETEEKCRVMVDVLEFI